MRYGAALAGAALALCALFFVSVAQEKLAVRMPEPIQGSLYIAFLRLDGRQMSWGLLPLLLAGAHLLLCRALTDLLLKQEVYDRFAGAGREIATAALLLAALSLAVGALLAHVWRLRGRALGAALAVLLVQGAATALCGGCIFPCVPESGSVYGVADMWMLFMAFFAQTVVLRAAVWLVLFSKKDVSPKESM